MSLLDFSGSGGSGGIQVAAWDWFMHLLVLGENTQVLEIGSNTMS